MVFSYEKDFFSFSLIGSFDITNSTYLWSQAFKLSVQEDLYFMSLNILSEDSYDFDKLLISTDFTWIQPDKEQHKFDFNKTVITLEAGSAYVSSNSPSLRFYS